MKIKLFLNKDINFNANHYFSKAKKLKNKLPGIEETVDNTKKLIKDFEKEKENYLKKSEENRKIKKYVKKEWYDKFRYSFTSNGLLLVFGKDSTTNEILLKKHLEESDLVFHTEAAGSPFGILKKGKESIQDKEILYEAAQVISCFSKQWKKGYGTADAFWVLPDQVSKKAESGEYISKGSFMIRGKKNEIKNIVLNICVGVYEKKIEGEEGDEEIKLYEIISGSEKACKKFCGNRYAKLEPGINKYKILNKEITKKINFKIEDLPKYVPNECKVLKK